MAKLTPNRPNSCSDCRHCVTCPSLGLSGAKCRIGQSALSFISGQLRVYSELNTLCVDKRTDAHCVHHVPLKRKKRWSWLAWLDWIPPQL